MLKPNLRRFILELPGLNGYCSCEYPCSKIEIDYVIPKKILKQKLNKRDFLIANKDPHNLYKCCNKINSEKGCLLLGHNYEMGEFSGILARSALYMNFEYNLNFHSQFIIKWNNYSLFYPPFEFEYIRSKIIYDNTGKKNIYIDEYLVDTKD